MTAQPDDSTYQEARSSAPLDPDAPSHPLTQLRPDSDLGRQEYGGRNWGVSLALYALRSARSWGMGDFADLGDLAAIVAHVGGDYLVVGPVTSTTQQAVERLGFTCAHGGGLIVDPLHIRPEDIREVAYLPSSQRTMLDWGSETIRATNTQPDPINVDEVWEAKKAALEVAFSVPRTPARQALFHQFVRRHGAGLAPYVHAAVAAENPNSQALYEDLCADSSAGAAARRHHEERIEFHLWVQWVGREQLHAAHSNALATGMRIGVVHTMVEGLDAHSIADLGAFGGGVFLAHIEADGFDEAVVAARDAGMVVFAEG
ncbi:MAG TPA: 4-alpha-glucanotransferase, partial [Beutenbergiaceae bacterium]|nr:4-alpha-glucanotransferase [Beutenbergiaceae bacterium]